MNSELDEPLRILCSADVSEHYINASTHPYIPPFTHPCIHPSIPYTSTHPCMHPPILTSTHASTHIYIHSSTHSPTHTSTNPYIPSRNRLQKTNFKALIKCLNHGLRVNLRDICMI